MDFLYRLDASGDLELIYGDQTILRIAKDKSFGILYDTGVRLGMATLLKHGAAESVRAYHRDAWNKFNRGPDPSTQDMDPAVRSFLVETGRALADEMRMMDISVASLTSEAVDEINACLRTSGRIGKLAERLAELAPSETPSPS